jgi:hypothetical protein
MFSTEVQINDQHMRGKRMAKSMEANPFADAGFLNRRIDGLLKAGLQRVVLSSVVAARVGTPIPLWENILPGNFPGR